MSKLIHKLKHLTLLASLHNHPRPCWSLSTFRLSTFGLLLTFNFAFLISACGLDVEDPTPPSPPVWVQKSLPEEWPERGIDAHESGGIYLEWEPNPDINTYIIFRSHYYEVSDSLGEYEELIRIENDFTTPMKYLDSEVTIGTDYYYKIKSMDISKNLSAYSDSLGYSLSPALSINTMSPNGASATLNINRSLSWNYSISLELENYCLTLLSQDNNLILRVVLSPTNYVDGPESFQIPDSIRLEPLQAYKWRIDTGAKYSNEIETAGSESQWATFLYPETDI